MNKGEHIFLDNKGSNYICNIYGDQKQLAFGCSDDYFSLTLENDLYDGYSRMTQTYKNQRLNGNKDKFIIIKLEVWTFQNN